MAELEFELVLPCYNEARNLEQILVAAKEAALENGFTRQTFKLVLVENGSKDHSRALLEQLRTTELGEWFRIVPIDVNTGYGNGVWTGLQATSAPFVGWSHSDLQCHPRDAFTALKTLRMAPPQTLVKGRRTGRNWKDTGVSRTFEILTYLCLGFKEWDMNAQPKVFPREALRLIREPRMGFDFDVGFLFDLHSHGYRFLHIPVLFPPRIHGVSNWASNFASRYKTILRMVASIWSLRKWRTLKPYQCVEFWLGLLALVAITLFSGTNGIYNFDFGINTHMGWLITQGYKPFIDILSPLMPLSGLINALGFTLFGVTYQSGIYMAALLVGFGYLLVYPLMFSLVERNRFWSSAFSLAILVNTLPLVGVPYYNHLQIYQVSLLLLGILYWIKEGQFRTPNRKSHAFGLFYLAIFFLSLCKFHIGILYLPLVLSLDLFLPSPGRPGAKGWAMRGLPSLLLGGLFLAWLDFDFTAIAEGLFHTAKKDINWMAIYHLFGLGTDVFAQPEFGLVCFLLLLIAWPVAELREKGSAAFKSLLVTELSELRLRLQANPRWLTWFLGVYAVLVQALTVLLSGEAPSASVYLYFFLLLIFFTLAEKKSREFLALFQAIFISLFLFSSFYLWSGMRKSWSERGQWIYAYEHPPLLQHRINLPFFAGARVRLDQKAALEKVDEIIGKFPLEKVYFGPGLEILYGAYSRLPPRPWPLWVDFGHSMKANFFLENLAPVFLRENYGFLFFSLSKDAYPQVYGTLIHERYVRFLLERTTGWLVVYVRKDLQAQFVNTVK